MIMRTSNPSIHEELLITNVLGYWVEDRKLAVVLEKLPEEMLSYIHGHVNVSIDREEYDTCMVEPLPTFYWRGRIVTGLLFHLCSGNDREPRSEPGDERVE